MKYMSKNILDVAADECQVLDFHDLMYKFTLDSFVLYVKICYYYPYYYWCYETSITDIFFIKFSYLFYRLGFGVHLNAMGTKGKVPFAEAFDDAQKDTFMRFVNPAHVVSEAVMKLFYPNSRSMTENLKVVDDFARDVIEKRRKEIASGQEFRDLLSRFMTAKNKNGQPLSNDEVKIIIIHVYCYNTI